MDLIRQFESYYQSPTTPRRPLVEAILNYDFTDYLQVVREVASLKGRYLSTSDLSVVKSNGSTFGSKAEYLFGPRFGHWCPVIEQELRGFDVQLRLAHKGVGDESTFYERPVLSLKRERDYVVHLDLTNEDNRRQLVDVVADLAARHDAKVSLCGRPNAWLLLSTDDPAFQDFKALRPYTKSLINEDWELWVKPHLGQEFFMNDQMIDWRTGLNFYTCPHGTKHFLPIFFTDGHRASNLLNLAFDDVNCADLMEFDGKEICPCGKPYIPFRFRPQRHNYLDVPRDLIYNLASGYINFQLVRLDDRYHLMYSTVDGGKGDLDSLAARLDGELVLHEDIMYYIGRKKYSFWVTQDYINFRPYARPGKRSVAFL